MLNRISSTSWNSLVRHLGTRYPIRVKVAEPSEPTHAWRVAVSYDPQKKIWSAVITPGSVNGKIAEIVLPFGRAPENFQRHQRLAKPSFPFADTTRVGVPLDFRPSLDLNWREIGGGAGPTLVSVVGGEIRQTFETVPRFFLRQGVRPGGSSQGFQPGQRRLFASDLVLNQPRTALVNEVSVFPGGVLGGSIVSVNAVSSTPQDSREPPRVVSLSRFAPAPIQNTFAEIFFQRFLDEPADQLHLSTVYALSPPLEEGGSFPDGVDQGFALSTRYYCHYNLAHATRTLPRVRTPPITLVTGLAAGLGDVMFNYILSFSNDFAQATLDLFNQRSLRGSFWVV